MALHSLSNAFITRYGYGNMMENQLHTNPNFDCFLPIEPQPHIFGCPTREDISCDTSTSGRSPIEDLIRMHGEKILEGIDLIRKKHKKALEETIRSRMHEKEISLARARDKSRELEETIRRVSAEKQMWFDLARSNEALVNNLQQLLIHNNINGNGDYDGNCGEEDAMSCCEGGGGIKCRVCGGGEVRVVVLPCRHLCLCANCEAKVDTCPVCMGGKNASLHVSIC